MDKSSKTVRELLEHYRRERWLMWRRKYTPERLCLEYVEPLLKSLGWNLMNCLEPGSLKPQVVKLALDATQRNRQVCAFILKKGERWQSYGYDLTTSYYLIGVTKPPLVLHTVALRSAMRDLLPLLPYRIDSLVLTDFTRMVFYDHGTEHRIQSIPRWVTKYSLPCRHYLALWEKLRPLPRVGFKQRLFNRYAAKPWVSRGGSGVEKQYANDDYPSAFGSLNAMEASSGYDQDDRSESLE